MSDVDQTSAGIVQAAEPCWIVRLPAGGHVECSDGGERHFYTEADGRAASPSGIPERLPAGCWTITAVCGVGLDQAGEGTTLHEPTAEDARRATEWLQYKILPDGRVLCPDPSQCAEGCGEAAAGQS